MVNKRSLVVLAVLLVALSGCLGGGEPTDGANTTPDAPENGGDADGIGVDAPEPYTDARVEFSVGGGRRGELGVEIAETPAERRRGLSGRDSLPDGTGMLFVYNSAGERAFWMRNTLVPLDMIFVDAEMRVLNVEHAPTEPLDTPNDELTRYRSDGPAQYVVETDRGYANRTGVSPGDRLVIER